MNTLPIEQPPVNMVSQGAAGFKSALVDPLHDVWLLNCSGAPANGEGNGWAGVGSLAIDHTNGKLYQQTGTLAATVWTVFEASGGTVLFSSQDAITAHSTGGKTSAYALTKQISRLSTVAAAGDSALLPASAAGGFAVVTNEGANAADLYGAGSDTINDVVTTAPFYLPVGATAVFYSTVAGKWYGGLVGVSGATSQAQPSAPTAPSSTSAYLMQGLAGSITPVRSGKVLLIISGDIIGASTTAGDGIDYQLSYGTGTAPTNNTTLAGTQVGQVQGYKNPTTVTAADILVPFSTQAVITGLTLGTAYWLDLAAKALADASEVGLTNVSVTAAELP